jgi:pimeloyl-ACP methyl ester carboxylesterase
MEKKVGLILYVVIVIALIAVIGSIASWVLFVPAATRIFGQQPLLLPRLCSAVEDAQQCEFSTADGLVLRGSYVRTTHKTRRGTVICCHELGGNRWGAVPYIRCLREAGYDVLTFDFRNHGSSDRQPQYRPMQWVTEYDVLDMQAAIDYVVSRPDTESPHVGLLGISRGGNAALCVAASDPRVAAIVADSPFPTQAMQVYFMRRFMHVCIPSSYVAANLPDACLLSFCLWSRFLLGLRKKCRILNVDRLVKRVRQPVLMIHGDRDSYVPIQVARRFRSCLAGRTRHWIVPGAKHNHAVTTVHGEYHRRIVRFFRNRLREKRGTNHCGCMPLETVPAPHGGLPTMLPPARKWTSPTG